MLDNHMGDLFLHESCIRGLGRRFTRTVEGMGALISKKAQLKTDRPWSHDYRIGGSWVSRNDISSVHVLLPDLLR